MPGDLYNALASNLRTNLREQLRIVRASIEDATQRDAPVLSGDLRNSIVMDDFIEGFDSFTSTIRATAFQARWTNDGTGIYGPGGNRIYPLNGRVLGPFYWYRIGETVAFRSVAGIPAQHWWDGPSGTRFEERLRDATAAAFGGF